MHKNILGSKIIFQRLPRSSFDKIFFRPRRWKEFTWQKDKDGGILGGGGLHKNAKSTFFFPFSFAFQCKAFHWLLPKIRSAIIFNPWTSWSLHVPLESSRFCSSFGSQQGRRRRSCFMLGSTTCLIRKASWPNLDSRCKDTIAERRCWKGAAGTSVSHISCCLVKLQGLGNYGQRLKAPASPHSVLNLERARIPFQDLQLEHVLMMES